MDTFRFMQFKSFANPPAGVGLGITVPVGESWRVKAMHATLVTSATVGNRQPYLTFTKDGFAIATIGTAFDTPASTTKIYNWGIGSPNYVSTFATLVQLWMPDLWMPQGSQIQLQTNNIQPGDQWMQIWLGIQRQ
jgi:hypothetical protein